MEKKGSKQDSGDSFLDDGNFLSPSADVDPQDDNQEEPNDEQGEPEPEDDPEEKNPEPEPEPKQKPTKAPVGKHKPSPPENLNNVRVGRGRNDKLDPSIPQIPIIDRDGNTERRRRAVEIGLSERVLPPLTRGRAAVYQWIDSDRIDPLTGLKPDPKDPILPGSYMFFDPFEKDPLKKNKLMRNLGRPDIERDDKGREVIANRVKDIEFIAGIKRVVPDAEYLQYVFMELHPLNASNKFRRPGGPSPKFRRVDILSNKSDAYEAAFADLQFQAERAVVDLEDRDLIIGYAAATNQIPTNGVLTARIKTDLRIWARQNPRKFFSMHNNVELPAKLNLQDALGLGIISYEPDKKRYIDPEAGKELFTHSVHEDPFESFVKAMVRPENKPTYNYIVDLLNYWEE